jgi:hypothetical protein
MRCPFVRAERLRCRRLPQGADETAGPTPLSVRGAQGRQRRQGQLIERKDRLRRTGEPRLMDGEPHKDASFVGDVLWAILLVAAAVRGTLDLTTWSPIRAILLSMLIWIGPRLATPTLDTFSPHKRQRPPPVW